MSEAPGQVLARTTAGEALARAVDEYLGRSLGRPTLGNVDWDEVAAAFLAEMEARERNRRRNACSICGKPKDTVVMACRSCLDSDAGGW